MSDDKKHYIKVITPLMPCAYAWFAKPDEKFGEPKFKCTLLIDKDDDYLEVLTDQINEAVIAEWGSSATARQSPLVDGDTKSKPEFKGKMLLTAKSKFQPGFIDAKRVSLFGKDIPKSGDLIRISGVLLAYDGFGGGISLQLHNVQLGERRNFGNDAASDFDELDDYDGLAPEATDASGDF